MPSQRSSAFLESVWVALGSLRASKLRSFLTLLGIILATTTLIAVMSLIHGMDVYIAEKVSDMGADGFRVVRMAFIGDWDAKKFLEYQRRNPELKREEFDFIRQNATLVKEIGMAVYRRGPLVFGGDRVDQVQIIGESPNMATIENTQVESGRYFSDIDNNRHLMVAFLGHDLKDRWFPNTEAVGKSIHIDGRPYEVIGVAKAKGSVFGQTQDSFVSIPVETYFKSYGARKGINYSVVAISHDKLLQSQDEVRSLIRSYRHLTPGKEDNFAIFNSDSLTNAWSQMTGAIAATAIAVVSVFMVVGGVVIMNIMLAVVSERTQEIGIRKSLGARRQDILNQFLVESAVLAASGGVFGVAIAWTFAIVIRTLTPVPMSMPIMSVALGVGLSMTVGLFFGIYPARQASKLDPIEALRVER
ncbi:ABC transporter permease [Bryobacter aggregatus]|uniref:ABC transporter permease n=1 Tax=Bryobacter aggregatus TaxID=360054 RepID=UPI0004E25C40|nr:ABC transporter permease [Bryobacter aggregatus]